MPMRAQSNKHHTDWNVGKHERSGRDSFKFCVWLVREETSFLDQSQRSKAKLMQSRITIVNRKFCLLRSAFFFQSISDRVIRVLQLFLFLFFFFCKKCDGKRRSISGCYLTVDLSVTRSPWRHENYQIKRRYQIFCADCMLTFFWYYQSHKTKWRC